MSIKSLFTLRRVAFQPMLPCFLSGTTRSKHCFPFTQGDGCQHWYQRGRFSGCPVCFFPKIHSISPSPPTSLLPSLCKSFLASHRLARSQARVVGGAGGFILVPNTLCYTGGWVGTHTQKRVGQKGGGEDGQRLVESGHKTKIALCFNFF